MRTQARDTSPETEAILFARYRSMTLNEKFGMFMDMVATAEALMRAGIRAQFPNLSHAEENRIFAERWFGLKFDAQMRPIFEDR